MSLVPWLQSGAGNTNERSHNEMAPSSSPACQRQRSGRSLGEQPASHTAHGALAVQAVGACAVGRAAAVRSVPTGTRVICHSPARGRAPRPSTRSPSPRCCLWTGCPQCSSGPHPGHSASSQHTCRTVEVPVSVAARGRPLSLMPVLSSRPHK